MQSAYPERPVPSFQLCVPGLKMCKFIHMELGLLYAHPGPHVPVTMAMSSWRRFWHHSKRFTKHNRCCSTQGGITGIKEGPSTQ